MAYKNFKSTEIIEEIGSELRKIRLSKGITINHVAEQLSQSGLQISNTLLSRVENGTRRIDDDLLNRICAYYEVNPIDVVIAASEEHIRRLSNNTMDYNLNLDEYEPIDVLIEKLNDEGQREAYKLMRMMSYMNAYKKL